MKRNRWGLLYTTTLVLLFGAFLGVHNINSATSWAWETPLYLIAAAVFSFHRPRQAWCWAFLLAATLYVSHVWAIADGYVYPYVEQDFTSALACFILLPLTLAGALIGCTLRWGHDSIVRQHSR